jgi:hypothetical protein
MKASGLVVYFISNVHSLLNNVRLDGDLRIHSRFDFITLKSEVLNLGL